MTKSQQAMRPALPKRFYKEVSTEERPEGIVILLDGRPVRTPGRRLLAMPTTGIADAVAAEWRAQGETVDPSTMPVTRIVNTTLDGVAENAEAVRTDLARFAETDLLCYRAEEPDGLIARQNEQWDPIIDWARRDLGMGFVLAAGIVPVAQPAGTLERVADLLAGLDIHELAGLHVMTSLTGSLLIALAVMHGRLSVDEAWAAAHVDEDWQISRWGADAEAETRRRRNRVEMDAAALVASARRGRAA